MSRLFLCKCPKCGGEQKTRIYSKFPANHYKICVYCGKRFNIHKPGLSSQIIREIV